MILKRKLFSIFSPKFPIYVFHHIPKCGGSAVKFGLKKWFNLVSDYISIKQLQGYEKVASPIDLSTLNSSNCLCGHFECEYNYLILRYPEIVENPKKFQLFTFIRDPLELRISLYYYEIKKGRRDINKQSLKDYLLSGDNYLAKRFPCDYRDYQKVLNRYTFIGFQEHLQESMDQLSSIVHKPKLLLPQVNLSPRDLQNSNLSEDIISSFKRINKLDYLIYNYAQKKHTLGFELS